MSISSLSTFGPMVSMYVHAHMHPLYLIYKAKPLTIAIFLFSSTREDQSIVHQFHNLEP